MEKNIKKVEIFEDFDYDKNEGPTKMQYIYPIEPGALINIIGLTSRIMTDFSKQEDVNKSLEKVVALIQKATEKRDEVKREAIAEGWTQDQYREAIAASIGGEFDAAIIQDGAAAIGFLSEYMPSRVMQIISVLSRIDEKTLSIQNAETLFDIWDAVIEVNDIPKLVERVGKSVQKSKQVMAFKKKVEEATGAKVKDPITT
jgi:hypothetical protein